MSEARLVCAICGESARPQQEPPFGAAIHMDREETLPHNWRSVMMGHHQDDAFFWGVITFCEEHAQLDVDPMEVLFGRFYQYRKTKP